MTVRWTLLYLLKDSSNKRILDEDSNLCPYWIMPQMKMIETCRLQIPCEMAGFKGEKIEPISVAFTLVFGVMLTLQFIAMLFHRYSTMLHVIAITNLKVFHHYLSLDGITIRQSTNYNSISH